MRAFLRRLALWCALWACLFACARAEETSDFIQLGDYGSVVGALQALLGVSESAQDDPFFGERTLAALKDYQHERDLPADGEFSPQTLCALLGVCADDPQAGQMVWIPMHGGERYHSKATCSNMLAPRLIPLACALEMDFTPCKRCH